ncbi:DUF1002 domain-containing protein [Pasteuria penetrans]|uniref:DUF1002 domain-containing protein n=1 Tax=Pasteuria penetrans TaxID=86005 RepID=UPI000FBE7642|nr:DUF1002 domain-containing protein [Pasteuria penetrans]
MSIQKKNEFNPWNFWIRSLLILFISLALPSLFFPVRTQGNWSPLAYADTEDEIIIVLGEDQTPPEREQELLKYNTVTDSSGKRKDSKTGKNVRLVLVANSDEKELLGSNFASLIGERALSDAKIEIGVGKNEVMVGQNITKIPAPAYASALVTAGVRDARVWVDAPRPVSGTGALAGIIKAFETARGKQLDPARKKTAAEEMSLISQISEKNNPNKTIEFITLIKQGIIEGKPESYEDYKNIIVTVAEKLDIALTPQLLDSITRFAQSFASLDLSWTDLLGQFGNMGGNLKDIFDIKNLQKVTGITFDQSLLDKVISLFKNIIVSLLESVRDIINSILKSILG